jgi:hypothetical protein
MTLQDLLDEVTKLCEERPDLQERISALLLSLVVQLRKNSQCRPGDLPPIDFQDLAAWSWLIEKFGDPPTYSELLTLAQEYSDLLDIELPRQTKRRSDLLVAWFNHNLTSINEAPFTMRDDIQ